MENTEHMLSFFLKYIDSLPELNFLLKNIFKDKTQKKKELKESYATLKNDPNGLLYLRYLEQLTKKDSISIQDLSFFLKVVEQGTSKKLSRHYFILAEVFFSSLLFFYKPKQIDNSGLYRLFDFFIIQKFDFILMALPVFNFILDPKDLTPPLNEKLNKSLIEHYYMEDVFLFLITCTKYSNKELLKIIQAFAIGLKAYRIKREKRHRLLDRNKVSKMWFHKPFKTLKKLILKRYAIIGGLQDRSERELEEFAERLMLEEIKKHITQLNTTKDINEKKPTRLEKLCLELVLIRNKEQIYSYIIRTVPQRKKLQKLCEHVWKYMHLLRIRSLREEKDKETIYRQTKQHALEEIKGTAPVILYIEDNGRYQEEFTRLVNFECQILEIVLPKIIVYQTLLDFKQNIPKILDETKDALAHIFIIDGIIADGTWKNVLKYIEGLERKLWEYRHESLYSLKYIFTGDIDIAREAYQAKILEHAPIDGVFIKPLESWDNAFVEISLRARKTGIQTDDLLYRRIGNVIKEVAG